MRFHPILAAFLVAPAGIRQGGPAHAAAAGLQVTSAVVRPRPVEDVALAPDGSAWLCGFANAEGPFPGAPVDRRLRDEL